MAGSTTPYGRTRPSSTICIRSIRTNTTQPREPTRVYVYFDADNLYIAARLYDDDPDTIVARILRQGERVNSDDFFAVIVDPFYDHRSGYRFDVNPNGVRDDAIYQNTSRQLREWEGIWRAAAQIDARAGQSKWPFRSRRCRSILPADAGASTSCASCRVKANTPVGSRATAASTPALPERAVRLLRSRPRARSRHRACRPAYATAKSYSGAADDTTAEPSLDLFYKLTPALNGSLTVNTDFSATEVDDRQVDLSRFSLFFPEKRAFFLKDSDIFEFGGIGQLGDSAAFPLTRARRSRTAGRFSRAASALGDTGEPVGLDYGGKLSGRIGRWSLGTLAIRQDETPTTDAEQHLRRPRRCQRAQRVDARRHRDPRRPALEPRQLARRRRFPLPEQPPGGRTSSCSAMPGTNARAPKGSKATTQPSASGCKARIKQDCAAASVSKSCSRTSIRHSGS